MSEELLFKNLFEKALKDWPETLELQTEVCVGVEPTNKGYELIRYQELPWMGIRILILSKGFAKLKKEYMKNTKIIAMIY